MPQLVYQLRSSPVLPQNVGGPTARRDGRGTLVGAVCCERDARPHSKHLTTVLDTRIFAHRSPSPYLSPAFLRPFYHPRITPLVIGALKPVEMLRPRSSRSIGQLSDGKVFSMKSSCLPTTHLSHRRRRATLAIKKRTRTFQMHLRHLISPYRSPSHPQLPPASQATRNYRLSP